MTASQGRYQFLNSLTSEEYAALEADIAKRGVMVPVELDEAGNILDGYHRVAIASKLGIEYPTIARRFDTEDEKKEHALRLNLLRRHLGPVAWAEVFKRLLELRGVQSGQGSRNDRTSDTVSEVAKGLGVNERTARRRLALAEELAPHPDLAEKVDRGEMEAKRARRVARERTVEPITPLENAPTLPAGMVFIVGDFREVLADVPDGSIDLVFTDPPYPKDYLHLWSPLAELAARVLKPGGLLVTYAGQYHLPAVMHSLAEHLEYVWLGSLVAPGAHNQVHGRHIRNGSKPILFYAKGTYEPGTWFEDTYTSEERIKDDHEWQQSVGAAEYYIDRLSEPGQTVLEPFLGSGTTGVAAHKLGRNFIGVDIDSNIVQIARSRVLYN